MKFKHINYMAPLSQIPDLDTSSRWDVLESVEQLQAWTGDETSLEDKSIKDLLDLQEKLQRQLFNGKT